MGVPHAAKIALWGNPLVQLYLHAMRMLSWASPGG